jgi:DNA oxidative demethylase
MRLAEGIEVFPGHLSPAEQVALLREIDGVLAAAPLFVPAMPKTGRPMSVGMSNCGPLGWVTDKERGYRYQPGHPVTDRPWPPIPPSLLMLWTRLAGYPVPPEACLINIYRGSAKMGQHRDQDESDFSAPVLSVSLGDDAVFSIGGLSRKDPRQRLVLRSGDVFLFGGPARLIYHGVDRVMAGTSQLVSGGGRINLTLRRVTMPAGL